MLLYCHWHINNLKCILPVQLKVLLCLSLCNTKFCNRLLMNDTAGLKFQFLLSGITCVFKYSFGNVLLLCTYMIFQVNLVINLIWQNLLNDVRWCHNYYLRSKITELPYVARTTRINMHTFLFCVLKEHQLIEPCRLKGTFRGQLLLSQASYSKLVMAGSCSALCIWKDRNSTNSQTPNPPPLLC